MTWLRNKLFSFALFLLLSIVSLAPSHTFAQASRTATKSADISAFGGIEFANPEYGPNDNTGGALGVDFTRYFHIPIQPSLEVRANFNNGIYADEHSYLFGLRGAYQWHRLMPYADFLVGPGNIHYPLNLSYIGDNSIVYNYGGGIDLEVTTNFSFKLDLQQQRWNTDTFAFNPVVGIIGVTYHIPFRPRYPGYGGR